MAERWKRRHSAPLKSKVALAAMREEASTAELAQSHGVHASQVSYCKRQSVEVVRVYFAGKFSRPQRAAADPVLLVKICKLQLRFDELEGRLQQLRHAGRLGLAPAAANASVMTHSSRSSS